MLGAGFTHCDAGPQCRVASLFLCQRDLVLSHSGRINPVGKSEA